MDLQAIVSELKSERDRLTNAIAALEGAAGGRRYNTKSVAAAKPMNGKAKKGRGRHLTAEGRKKLSEMMKKRWAERRRKSSGNGRKAA